jgi:hypothetical protein
MGSTIRLAMCLLLTGCVLVRPSVPPVEDITVAHAASGAASTPRTPSDVLKEASTLCVSRINELEKWGQNWDATVLTVGTVGMVAGAIVVPALAAANAAKTAIAAWGGVSGVSSGVLTLAQGQKLSESQAAADLLRGQLIDGYTEYALASADDKMKTAVKLYGRCLFAPATVTSYQRVDYNLMIKAASAAASAADAAASAASSAAAAASAAQAAASR